MKLLAILCSLPLVVAPNAEFTAELAAEPADGGAVLGRPGDGSPVCGLGKAFHAGRRAALRARLDSGLVLVRGLPETRDYLSFRQDKTFWYLTGIESPDASVVIDVESGAEVLFLPARDKRKEVWEGELWDASDEWVRGLTGFADVRPRADLLDYLAEHLPASEGIVWTSGEPWVALAGGFDRAEPHDKRRRADPLDGRESREAALKRNLEERFDADVRELRPHLDALRLVKTPEEIDAMRRAARAGVAAMNEAVRSTRPGVGEWDLEALMSWVQITEGADGPAYHAIVGGGANSCILHYSANRRRIQDGEVVLIDYGPEVDHYTTDITRTWPANGRFSERQAELYDAVLDAQKAAIAAVKPGITLRDVSAAARAVLRERGLVQLMPHGVSHYIGLEVHDVGSYAAKLVPGVVFTIEPGVYEPETGIGIRIEDVVVVTEDGCENLTLGAPRERAEVERLVRSQGVLDPR